MRTSTLDRLLNITSELMARSSNLREHLDELTKDQSKLERYFDNGFLRLLGIEDKLKDLMREAAGLR